jgi:protein gp37
MGENSAIEWTHHTFNPWIGCTKVADGCTHCYAESFANRYGKAKWGPIGTRVKTSEANWRKPVKWNREAEAASERRRVFCASLADVFEDWDGPILHSSGEREPRTLAVKESEVEWYTIDLLRRDLFKLIDATPWLDWLLLTKRPENIRRMWPIKYDQSEAKAICSTPEGYAHPYYRGNVWLLTSIATQADAYKNVPELLKCRELVPVLGLSAEPLLGALNIKQFFFRCTGCGSEPCECNGLTIDWIIVGGESGPHARPMHPDWAHSIRDQCSAAGVPFFFKQWGEWAPLEVCAEPAAKWTPCGVDKTHLFDDRECVFRIGKKAAGRMLDGKLHDEYPQVEVPA